MFTILLLRLDYCHYDFMLDYDAHVPVVLLFVHASLLFFIFFI